MKQSTVRRINETIRDRSDLTRISHDTIPDAARDLTIAASARTDPATEVAILLTVARLVCYLEHES